MQAKEKIKSMIDQKPYLQKFLFIRGFLLTDQEDIDGEIYPFNGTWNHTQLDEFHVWTHPLTGFHYVKADDMILYLFGHAYNPYTMEYEEEKILKRIAAHVNKEEFINCINELTGVFVFGLIHHGKVVTIADASGKQYAVYGHINNHFYLSSHPQLIADLLDLEMDPFAKRMIHYKWYPRVKGGYLPGDLTSYAELKRLVPDMIYLTKAGQTTHKRFYPVHSVQQPATQEEYDAIIQSAADILKKNMELVSLKWKHPQISLTGGIDSNTTFAAANGVYDRIEAFTFLSAEKESIDVPVAKRIAERFHVPWTLYTIPESSEGLTDYQEKVDLIVHNNAYAAKPYDNELRKRVYLEEHLTADVEVKSWASEIIRAHWYVHFGRKKMPPLSAKLYRNLYKIFITDRKLAHEVDRICEKYIQEYECDKIPEGYLPADLNYHEVTQSSFNGMHMNEMKFYSDITIIYNNRNFYDFMYHIPFDDRYHDKHHLAMKKYLNEDLYDMGLRVVNMKETDMRAFLLNIIFTINMHLPF